MVKTVAFHNLGCKVNSYEMEKMVKDLSENGYLVVPFDQKADIYIINTCSVTNIADRKSRQMIHRAKTFNPKAVIVAAGCYVNTHGEPQVKAEGVDLCVLNEEKREIAAILDRYCAEQDTPVTQGIPQSGCDGALPALHTRSFLKVQDGCDAFCSYCIIPYARGRINSRRIADVVDEVGRLTAEGYSEFVLTGIHVSSYGRDRPEDGETLTGLIKAISDAEGVKRIRLSSLEPRIITEGFVSGLSHIPQLCPHFHLSLQSGSDTVLKRMNRHYTTEEYFAGVGLLRKYFDDPAVTTDIIAGFPGETEEEFNETLDFVDKVGFYETHIFKYSRRKGTVADRMPGQHTEAVKHERSQILSELNRKNKRAFEDRHIEGGKTKELLLEDLERINGREYISGYTREYIKAYAEAGRGSAGDIVTGRIVRNGNGDIMIK
ncbi:MAG: tRNA (N(6)-L-threonylcarbamoyladenosine(37)-C(2))-methylthiotransferase MtaB [Lachnospiraceae bacterium]|nr:tRNA (N(6)-L-threonylcarbamoyladenosine(37)-C(2))-methylthiotransferase MtaB [Lachnospiraceae bacterium]